MSWCKKKKLVLEDKKSGIELVVYTWNPKLIDAYNRDSEVYAAFFLRAMYEAMSNITAPESVQKTFEELHDKIDSEKRSILKSIIQKEVLTTR